MDVLSMDYPGRESNQGCQDDNPTCNPLDRSNFGYQTNNVKSNDLYPCQNLDSRASKIAFNNLKY